MTRTVQHLTGNELIKRFRGTDIFETLKHAKDYLAARIATQAIALVSVPIFTRLLTRADYGTLAIFSAYVGIFIVVLSLYSFTSVGRYYYEKKDDFGEFISTTLILVGLIFGLTLPLFFLFRQQIASLTQLPGSLLIYLVFVCLFGIVDSIYFQILVPQKRSKEAGIISVIKGWTTFGVAVLLVSSLAENRYLGQIWASLLLGPIFSIYFMMRMRQYLKFSFKIDHIKYIANFSFPLIPYALSGVILAQFDRIMINSIIDTASAGLYSVGYAIGMVVLLVAGSLDTALMPDFYKFQDNKQYARLDALVGKVFSIVTLAALGLVLFAREIVIVLAAEEFHPALSVVPIVVMGGVFYEMFGVYGRYIHYEKRTVFSTITILASGILNIALNAVFIPRYGYVAAAYTTVASYLVLFVLTWITAKWVLKVRLTPLWVIWRPALIMFCFIGLVLFLNTLRIGVIPSFIIKLGILALFGVIVFNRELRFVLRR